MVVSTGTIGIIIGYIVSIIALAASSYGLGKEEHDKESSAYKAAIAFYILGLLGLLGTTLVLVWSKGTVSPPISSNSLGPSNSSGPFGPPVAPSPSVSVVPGVNAVVSNTSRPEMFIPSLPPLVV
jgi:hypothetical protein